MKTMKMPELSESGEADNETANINGSQKSSSSRSPRRGGTAMPPPEISVTSDEEDSSSKASGDELVRPPSPSDDPVTPSIPDSFLQQLGLSTEGTEINGEGGVDQLPDKQLESRFNSLALAFKTDRLTLEKRLGIQERSRDIAEQNIEKELQGLRDAVETLNRLCSDEQVQDVVAKICHHLDILEHSMARVSSRAEVFGAVQQEKRMCIAMEVMITFTENIRRLREKEQSEVEEARKVLTERSQSSANLGLDFAGIGGRSASVCAGFNNPRTTRRRSEVALPRFFGGSGSPSLHVSSSMEPRQRFQAATANVTVRNSITSSLRRASLDRQKNLSVQSSSSSSGQSRNNSIEKSDKTDSVKKQSSQEEEAYKLGYEEGLKASISRELNELRDQQTSVSSNVEQVMDRIETLQQEDTRDAELEEAVSKAKDIIVQVRQWMSNPNWQSASHTLRRIAAGLIFLVAMIIVILTFAPLVPGNITMRNHGKPAQ